MRGVRSAAALAILFLIAIAGFVILRGSANRFERQLAAIPLERRVATRLLTKPDPQEKWIRDFQRYQRVRKISVAAAWQEISQLAPAGMLYLDDAALVEHHRILHRGLQQLPEQQCARLAGTVTDPATLSHLFSAVDSASRDRLVEYTVTAGVLMALLKQPPPQLQPFEAQHARTLLVRTFTPEQMRQISHGFQRENANDHSLRCTAVRAVIGAVATRPDAEAAVLARAIYGGALQNWNPATN
jgi:hypothetical protein